MKRVPYFVGLILVLILNNCAPKTGTDITPTVLWTPVPTLEIEKIPVAIGEAPANAAIALVGTWHLENFKISSKGSLAGKLSISLDHPVDYISSYQDVLIIQVWASYIWPEYGGGMEQPAGKFIPIKASLSEDTSATFDIDGKFEFPQRMLYTDGGMPLNYIQVTMVWYRLSPLENSYMAYRAKIGFPSQGSILFDKTVSLSGTIDTNVRGDLDYSEWFRTNLPTSTPYPAPVSTFPPLPSPSYPLPNNPNP